MRNNKLIWSGVFIVIFILLAAGYFGEVKTAANRFNKKNGMVKVLDNSKLFEFSLNKPVFAAFENMPEIVVPKVPFYTLQTKEISNLKSFTDNEAINFTPAQLKSLEERGFYLSKDYRTDENWPEFDDYVDLYNRIQGSASPYYREPQNSLFITSDVGMHLFHVLIDRSFQKTEETKFQPLLLNITKALFKDSIEKYNTTTNQDLKNSYKQLSVYYLVPLATLESGSVVKKKINPEDFSDYAKYVEANDKQIADSGNEDFKISLEKTIDGININDEIYQLAKQEIELINSAKDVASSPLFTPLRPDFMNDYTQFTPRSHYTKNIILKSYFEAMMWYGRMGFTLNSPDLTRDALIITGQVNNLNAGDEKISKAWSDMSSAIEFFVGKTDDLTPYQYTDEIKKVYGDSMTVDQLSDNDLLNKFVNAAVQDLPTPKILSEVINIPGNDSVSKTELLKDTMQFRLMGQRFTPDAEILNRLTQGDEAPDPETGQKLPSTPTALMVASILNPENKTVKNYLDEWVGDKIRIKNEVRESDKVIAKVYGLLKDEFSKFDNVIWTQNIYWGWLNSLRSLLANYGSGYPAFMMNVDWQKKNLGTVLGSYTELKHDTLLYAKQNYAERGGGGEPPEMPPIVKGYVEPDVIFWDRLIALTEATRKGLSDRNVMPEEFNERYFTLINSLKFLRGIAVKELANEKISDNDFEKLRTISEADFESIVLPTNGETLTLKERRAGLIADISTDARLSRILYEANGKPYIIYVAVKDINGTRLTRGVIYNHNEFTGDLGERLNDEEWQDKAYSADNKTIPDKWSSELVK